MSRWLCFVVLLGLLWPLTSTAEPAAVTADRVRIQAHLADVEDELRARDPSHLSPELLAERKRNIERLHEYRVAGRFPHNTYVSGRTPVFIDADDRACAVGHLMIESGHEDAALRIAERENLGRLPRMSSSEIAAWLATSGLSAAEAARIQPSYSSVYCGQECSCYFNGTADSAPVCDGDGVSWLNSCVARACGAPGPYETGCCSRDDMLQLPDGAETEADGGFGDVGSVNGACLERPTCMQDYAPAPPDPMDIGVGSDIGPDAAGQAGSPSQGCATAGERTPMPTTLLLALVLVPMGRRRRVHRHRPTYHSAERIREAVGRSRRSVRWLAVIFLVIGCGSDPPVSSPDMGSDTANAVPEDLAESKEDEEDAAPPPRRGGSLGTGAACTDAAQCRGGVCLKGDEWPSGYCTSADCDDCPDSCFDGACAAECVDMECRDGYRCARVDSGLSLCVPEPRGAVHGAPCSEDAECAGGVCLTEWPGGYCTEVYCNGEHSCGHAGSLADCGSTRDYPLLCLARCEDSTQCREGYVCDRFQELCRPPQVTRVPADFPITCVAAEDGASRLPFDVAPDSRSLQLVPFVDGGDLFPRQLKTPGGEIIELIRANGFDVRDLIFDTGLKAVAMPPRYWERDMLEPGRWELIVRTIGDEACIYQVPATTAGRELDLQFILVGVPGLDRVTAASHPTLSAALAEVRRIFGAVGVSIGEVNYVDAPLDVAQSFQFIRSVHGIGNLLSRSTVRPSGDPMHLNIFLIRDFVGGGLLGIAGGIPGPAGVHGTEASGVIVAYEPSADEPERLGQTIAHEIGHYVGLTHIREGNGLVDLATDTPECYGAGCNADRYLMYPWAVDGASRLSTEQGWIIKTNPMLRPGAGCDCSPLATCNNGVCECPEGMVGDGVTCDDIDQCVNPTLYCDANFSGCTDLLGGVECGCAEGWTGDGFTCDDLDECAMGSHSCDRNATCNNLPGTYECICNPGWQDDGAGGCEDLDECPLLVCPQTTVCKNLIGSFECHCPHGTLGTPPNCAAWEPPPERFDMTDIHTCALDSKNNIRCWGQTTQSGTSHPGPFVDIATILNGVCGVRPNGTEQCWGASPNTIGDTAEMDCQGTSTCCRLSTGGDLTCGTASFPGPISDFRGGWNWTALDGDGEVAYTNARYAFHNEGPFNQVTAVCSLATSGDIWCKNSASPIAGPYVAVSNTGNNLCGIRPGGTVDCYVLQSNSFAAGIGPAGTFTSISVGAHHACGITTSGTAECWGQDSFGETQVPANFP